MEGCFVEGSSSVSRAQGRGVLDGAFQHPYLEDVYLGQVPVAHVLVLRPVEPVSSGLAACECFCAGVHAHASLTGWGAL
jgi:hypothetical protein